MQEIVLDAERVDINQEKKRIEFKLYNKPPVPYKKKTEYNLR